MLSNLAPKSWSVSILDIPSTKDRDPSTDPEKTRGYIFFLDRHYELQILFMKIRSLRILTRTFLCS